MLAHKTKLNTILTSMGRPNCVNWVDTNNSSGVSICLSWVIILTLITIFGL